jgi:hypothetical protein
MIKEKVILCFNCVKNDTFTLEMTRGWDKYTGMSFVVYKKDEKEMFDFIKETILSNGLPIDNIQRISWIFNNKSDVDTKESIVKKVLEEKDKVLKQVDISERDYGENLRGGNIVEGTLLDVRCVVFHPEAPRRCPGARYEGYRFNVKKEEKDEMIKFIKEALRSNGIPLIKIVPEDLGLINDHNLDSKEDIVTEILKVKNIILSIYNERLEEKSRKK